MHGFSSTDSVETARTTRRQKQKQEPEPEPEPEQEQSLPAGARPAAGTEELDACQLQEEAQRRSAESRRARVAAQVGVFLLVFLSS